MSQWYDDAALVIETKVVSVIKNEKNTKIVVENSNLYPGGGGQPPDFGVIKAEGFEGHVVDVIDGVLIVENKKGNLKSGMIIEITRNELRRETLRLMHTGEHLIFKSLQTILPELKVVKIDLGIEESKLHVSNIPVQWKDIFEAEKIANQIIIENRDISERTISKDEALQLEGLRIKPERISENEVRIVEVKNFDLSACKGLHSNKTGKVGSILVTGLRIIGGSTEIRFVANAQKMFLEYAKSARQIAVELGTSVSESHALLKTRLMELSEVKQVARKNSINVDIQKTKVGGHFFFWFLAPGMDNKQLGANTCNAVDPKGFSVGIREEEGKSTVVFVVGKDLDANAGDILSSVLLSLGGKGGGRERFAMGSCPENGQVIIEKIKDSVKNS